MRSGARASSATPRPQSPPSTTSSPRCRPRPWTTPSVSGPASTARHMACRHGREGPARASADRRRAPDDGRGGGTRLRHGSGRWRSTARATKSRRTRALQQPRPRRPVTVDAMHAQHETARCLLGRRADYVAPSRTIRKPSSKTSRRSTSATRPGTKPSTRAMAASSAAAVPSTLRRRMGRLREPPRAPPGDAHRTRARDPQDRQEQHRSDLEPHLARHRAGPRSFWPWSVTTGTSKTGCTTCAVRRRPLPGVCASPAPQSRLPDVAIAIVRCSGRFRYLPDRHLHRMPSTRS